MTAEKQGKRDKFPKPRGWAVGWVFAQETEPAPAEQVQEEENGAGKKMAEPRSWAVRWDGFALSRIRGRRNSHDQDPPG